MFRPNGDILWHPGRGLAAFLFRGVTTSDPKYALVWLSPELEFPDEPTFSVVEPIILPNGEPIVIQGDHMLLNIDAIDVGHDTEGKLREVLADLPKTPIYNDMGYELICLVQSQEGTGDIGVLAARGGAPFILPIMGGGPIAVVDEGNATTPTVDVLGTTWGRQTDPVSPTVLRHYAYLHGLQRPVDGPPASAVPRLSLVKG